MEIWKKDSACCVRIINHRGREVCPYPQKAKRGDRKEVIKLLGGVISGMNVGQPVIMQAANSEAQEPTEDVMDDADVAGLAMGWMSKGD